MEENINMGQPPIQNPPPPPATETPPPPPPPPPPVEHPLNETPKKKSFVKPLLFILIFLLLAAGIYYLIFEMNIIEKLTGENLDNNVAEEQPEEDDIEEDTKETETLTPFDGEYISTEIPDGWEIEEYKDGEGTTMLPDIGGYTGLTGLKIFKGEQEIFFMQAVSGLGFAGCPNYAKFTDENPEYYSQIVEDNEIIGEDLNVTDYTNSQYQEFTWLGIPFRRIAKEYLYDETLGNEYFESPCVPSLISFENISLYTSEDGYESSTYDYGAKEDATEQDLLVVDQILADMKLVESE